MSSLDRDLDLDDQAVRVVKQCLFAAREGPSRVVSMGVSIEMSLKL